jgi:hypothetical protein
MTVGTNYAGTIIFLIAFGLAAGGGALLGFHAEGPLTIAGGAIVVTLDLAFRLLWRRCGLFDRKSGGCFLFLPIWLWGVFWIGLGIADTCLLR